MCTKTDTIVPHRIKIVFIGIEDNQGNNGKYTTNVILSEVLK